MWLHGFTQTAQSGYEFQRHVRASRELCTIDLPGHGTNASVHLDLPSTAIEIANAVGRRAIDLGGYSLGGRVALHVAATNPGVLRRLVILSATAGIADETERAERRHRDEILAERCVALGAASFLEEWTAQPMFADLPVDPAEFGTRSQDVVGLAASLRSMGTGTQVPLDGMLTRCEVPALIMAGANDQKFVREAHRLRDCMKNSRVELVPDSGHAAHLERPEYVASLVNEFLAEEHENA